MAAVSQKSSDKKSSARKAPWGIAALLVQHDGGVAVASTSGNSALMLAAEAGQRGTVELLLTAGADRSLRNKRRGQAAEIATSGGHRELADLAELLR